MGSAAQAETLGILAGGGPFPGRVAAAAQAAGRPVFLVAFSGFADPAVVGIYPHETIRVGAAGEILAALRRHGCRDLVLVGPVKRPSLLDLRPDAEGTRILARIGRAAFRGDDGLLAAVVRVLGEEGFRVLGAHEVLTEALGPRGVLGRVAPDAAAMADLVRAAEVVRALGSVDVGQGCVVQQGIVLAVEAIEGTDAMLARAAGLARPGPGGVLLKMVKPGQDRRADLPAIGPATVRAAAAAGLRGVGFEAGGTLLTDRAACIAEADAAGLFLMGIDPDMPGVTNDGNAPMSEARLLHTMLRVKDLDASVNFYTKLLGMKELRRREVPDGKYTLAFVGYGDEGSSSVIELTFNWDQTTPYELGAGFGHLAVGLPDVYKACEDMKAAGAKITREAGPVKFGTTVIAFVEDPDGYKVELVQRG